MQWLVKPCSGCPFRAFIDMAAAPPASVISRAAAPERPLIVGLGGGIGAASSTEQALELALEAAAKDGARTKLFGGNALSALPLYLTIGASGSVEAGEMIASIRVADGVIVASPSYHGSLSGAVKNAIDYLEATARDDRPYLTDLPVGLISVAGGHQGASSTLASLRSIVHALRGCPTPFGAAISVTGKLFADGKCLDEGTRAQIELVGTQTARLARQMRVTH